mmetsp:Transcript_3969/g.9417  ORF Transcript_3969/g.9417 Transcript_3969/m.9417 type:complete len:224 (+) Transcript_3969:734-1405(+)
MPSTWRGTTSSPRKTLSTSSSTSARKRCTVSSSAKGTWATRRCKPTSSRQSWQGTTTTSLRSRRPRPQWPPTPLLEPMTMSTLTQRMPCPGPSSWLITFPREQLWTPRPWRACSPRPQAGISTYSSAARCRSGTRWLCWGTTASRTSTCSRRCASPTNASGGSCSACNQDTGRTLTITARTPLTSSRRPSSCSLAAVSTLTSPIWKYLLCCYLPSSTTLSIRA